MGVPVIDFSKLDGEERAATMAQIHNGCEEWGFFQLVNHGIPEELLERVKKVSTECYKLEREEGFQSSKPVMMLKELIENKSEGKVEGVDWEDVFLLTDANEWPSATRNDSKGLLVLPCVPVQTTDKASEPFIHLL